MDYSAEKNFGSRVCVLVRVCYPYRAEFAEKILKTRIPIKHE